MVIFYFFFIWFKYNSYEYKGIYDSFSENFQSRTPYHTVSRSSIYSDQNKGSRRIESAKYTRRGDSSAGVYIERVRTNLEPTKYTRAIDELLSSVQVMRPFSMRSSRKPQCTSIDLRDFSLQTRCTQL